ncbi:hypothetical protein HU200_049245 [Digitaria exilis]|uniref:DUF7910 domain-containing protein n=1 Tax=Digitaria exilis TaxID=1010633 RepID=A0A835ECA1_9POAL|nr:hypothetical protein HU200_049245 [Digitaria exilis]
MSSSRLGRVLLLVCSAWLLTKSGAWVPRIRATSLGGWLVTEGWIKPSLFDDIPNNDLLDGTQLQFKSVTQNRYLVAEDGGGAGILTNRAQASGWETFKLWRINATTFHLRVFGNQLVGVDCAGRVVATATTPGPSETFQLVRRPGDKSRVRIRAPNGLFLQAKTRESVTADRREYTDWSDDDPSVFVTNSVKHLQGEYQLCNGYGTAKATQVLMDAYNAVRRHTSTAYVIMPARFSADAAELLGFVGSFPLAVLDVHYYNLFSSKFNGLTVDQNIDFVRKNRSSELAAITRQNGRPLTFVGEWTAEWNVKGAAKVDYQRFAKAQLDVYGQATFGWAYWMLKNVNNHWSMEWMIQNGYIKLNCSCSQSQNAMISLDPNCHGRMEASDNAEGEYYSSD